MPSVSVAAIITKIEANTTQILLTKRSNNLSDFPGAWVLAGGRVDQYELREQAIIREVKEETGLHFHPTFFGVYDEIFEERGIHAVVTVYAGHCDGKLLADAYEVSGAKWFPLNTVLNNDIEFGFEHRKIISDYVNYTRNNINQNP